MGIRVFKHYSYGTTVETEIKVEGWQIQDRINEIPVMSGIIVFANGITPHVGESIRLYIDSVKTFEFILTKLNKKEEMPGYIYYTFEAAGNSRLMAHKCIAEVYDSQTSGYIVNDIFNKYLSTDGVTIGEIQAGPVLTKAVFNYVKGVEALNMLRDQTGFSWWIDKDRKLYWVAQATYNSPWSLTDTVQHSGFRQEENLDDYRNIQYLRGGLGITNLQVEELLQKPDGQRKTFTTRFPIANQTDMKLEIKIGGGAWTQVANSDIGVNGLDEGKLWYWSYNSPTISQDTAGTALTASDNIRLTYYGLVRIFVMSDRTSEISARQAVEGGSGEYHNLAVEEAIEDYGQALEFADGLLTNYGEVKDVISFNTEVPGLQTGQLLSVTKALFGISASFLLSAITITGIDPVTVIYSVTGLDGAAVGTWEEYFRKLFKKTKDFQIGANEVLSNLRTINDVYNHSGWTAIAISTERLLPDISIYTSMFPDDSTSNWVNEGNASIAVELGQGLQFTQVDAEDYGMNVRYNEPVPKNLSSAALVEFWMKIENPESLTNGNEVDLASGGGFYYKTFNAPASEDWIKYQYLLSDFSASGVPSWVAITSVAFYFEDNYDGVSPAAIAHVKDFVFYNTVGLKPRSGLKPGGGGSLENVYD